MRPGAGEQRSTEEDGHFAKEVAHLVLVEFLVLAQDTLIDFHAAFQQHTEIGLFTLACQPFAVTQPHVRGAAGEALNPGIIETGEDRSLFEIVSGNH